MSTKQQQAVYAELLKAVEETIEFLEWLSEGGMGWLTAPDKAGPLADKLEAAYRSATEKGAGK